MLEEIEDTEQERLIKPDLSDTPSIVVKYIELLERQIEDMTSDGFKSMYHSCQLQTNALAREMRTVKISLKGDDKAFDRFVKLQEVLRKIMENVEWLGIKTGAKEEKKEERKNENPIEARANQARSGSRKDDKGA